VKAISNLSALQIFQILRYTTLTLVSIIFAKSHLTKLEIGEYETFIFIAGAATFFWINGFIKSFLANNKRTVKKSSDIFNLYILILFLGILSFVSIKFISSNTINLLSYNYTDKIAFYILLLGTASISEYILLSLNKNKTLIAYGIIVFSLQFLIIIYPIILGKSIDFVLNSLLIIVLLKNIYTVFLVLRYSKIQFSFLFIKENIRFALPLIISFLLSGSAQFIDGFIIKYKFDDNIFAVFRYGAKEFPLLILLADAMSSVFVNEFSNENKDIILQKLKTKSTKLINWLFPLSIFLLIFSNYLYKYVFSEQFIDSAVIFDIYLLLIVSRLVFPQTVALGLKDSKLILKASVIELIINIVLSLVFVNYFGIIGVAIATVIAFYIEKVFLITFIRIKYKISSSKYISFKPIFIYSIILFSLFIIKYLLIS
jgi:O-antigen/teichoic acid export membrane protein